MNPELTQAVANLESVIDKLPSSDKNFAKDLAAYFHKHGKLSDKQAYWVGKLIARAEAPAKPVFSAPLTPSLTTPPAVVNVGDFAGVIALFNKAKEHLKFPKINLLVNGHKVVLSLNGAKSKLPGFVSISSDGKFGYRKFYGSVSPEGVFKPWSLTASFSEALVKLLTEFSANPARVAKDHGKLTGHCCFCNKELGLGEDKRSVLVGFGPVCAEHYGLKDQWLSGVAKAEAKASVAPVIAPVNLSTMPLEALEELASIANAPVAEPVLAADVAKAHGWPVDDNPKDETAYDVTPESQAQALIDKAAATLPLANVTEALNTFGQTVVLATTATVPFAVKLAEAAAEAEKVKITNEQLDKWLDSEPDAVFPVSEEFKDTPTTEELAEAQAAEIAKSIEGSFFVDKNAPLVTCFFCEKPSVDTSLVSDGEYDVAVCSICKDQLN